MKQIDQNEHKREWFCSIIVHYSGWGMGVKAVNNLCHNATKTDDKLREGGENQGRLRQTHHKL